MHYNFHRYYDPETGRYLEKDPLGLKGGINPFIYVQNGAVNRIDPTGLIQWSGTSAQVSAVELIGATFIRLKLISECNNGQKATIIVWATGPSVGFGAKFTYTFGSASFDDYDTAINPYNFNGSFAIVQAGITYSPGLPVKPPGMSIPPGKGPGVGIGASYIRLGNAYSSIKDPAGLVVGFDRSVGGSYGSSTVMNVKYEKCCR